MARKKTLEELKFEREKAEQNRCAPRATDTATAKEDKLFRLHRPLTKDI